MANRCRCDTSKATNCSRRGGASCEIFATKRTSTTPVCQATLGPDVELMGLRQAEEGCISLTAGGRRRAPVAPMDSRCFLRSSWTLTCTRDTRTELGMRPATSSTAITSRITARKTRSRQQSPDAIEQQVAVVVYTTKLSQQPGQKCEKREQD